MGFLYSTQGRNTMSLFIRRPGTDERHHSYFEWTGMVNVRFDCEAVLLGQQCPDGLIMYIWTGMSLTGIKGKTVAAGVLRPTDDSHKLLWLIPIHELAVSFPFTGLAEAAEKEAAKRTITIR
jgi:hypothetical protein